MSNNQKAEGGSLPKPEERFNQWGERNSSFSFF